MAGRGGGHPGNRGGGRPPAPTNLKLLRGDDKKNPQRINRNEPTPPEVEVTPPEDLSDGARAVWDRLAPGLIAAGVLTAWDIDAFTMCCISLVNYHKARKLVDGSALLVQGANGLVANPALKVLRDSEASFVTYASRFGLTPSDRAKIKIEPSNGGAKTQDAARLLS